jgi:hypothetical protein
MSSQRAWQRIWTAARNEAAFLAYRVAMPRHCLRCRKALLRRLAINLFRADTSRSISLPKKRKAAAWNPDYLATVLKLRGI